MDATKLGHDDASQNGKRVEDDGLALKSHPEHDPFSPLEDIFDEESGVVVTVIPERRDNPKIH